MVQSLREPTLRAVISIMVIGDDLTYTDLYLTKKRRRPSRRPINPTILDLAEWKRKRSEKNSFTEKINYQPKIFIVGSRSGLER